MEIRMNEDNRSGEYGLYPKESGQITLDKDIGCVAKFITSDTAGGVLVQNPDGRNMWIPYVGANELRPFLFTKVLSFGDDWQGIPRVTVTASLTYFAVD